MPSGVEPGAGVARLLSDGRLARRGAAGDRRALTAIFDRYHQRLYRYCLAIVGDSQDAQDALQNTMVKVLRALPGEERRIELKPWLYRIAHNESIELIRRRRDTRPLDVELAAPGSGLAAETESRERLRRLIADLDELPERQRGALVMRELGGLEFAEIGVALGTSAAVARQTLYEARLGLRQMDDGREMSCEKVTRALSDGDGRVARRRDIRAHLRACAGCRRFREEIQGRERDLAALSPLPAVAAAGLLHGLLGGNAGGGGLAAGLGGGVAKSLGASAALKGAATVAIVAAIGVGAADRGGLIDVGPGAGGSRATPVEQPGAAGPGAARSHDLSDSAAAAVGGAGSRAGGDGKVSAQRAAEPAVAAAPTRAPEETKAKAPPAPISQSPSSASHPHGKGHEKQHPSASAHGQQTAATHKAASHGSAAPKSHPEHPAKPSHPAHPSTTSTEDAATPPPIPAPPAEEKGPDADGPSAFQQQERQNGAPDGVHESKETQ
jgi:RNA polymerase sigma factor (sigma-70 family)